MTKYAKHKIWGGVFECDTSSKMQMFNQSLDVDKVLYKYDIRFNKAHVKGLYQASLITKNEMLAIQKALDAVCHDIESGVAKLKYEYEDIHMNVEMLVQDKIGDLAKKMHTGKSRNGQVIADVRMYAMDMLDVTKNMLYNLIKSMKCVAIKHIDSIMPGYTHLQRAQPISLGYYLCSYIESFKRDLERLSESKTRTSVSPVGCGSICGSSLKNNNIESVSRELGFDNVSNNAMDIVSNRDFIIEILSAISIISINLSRICEDFILWSTEEFGFIVISDLYSTGSSLMPNKKNPDSLELIRGKASGMCSNLMNVLCMMKGTPTSYNKDMQEDKKCLFDSFNNIILCIEILTGVIETCTYNVDKMKQSVMHSYSNATHMLDYLVNKGVSFRDAHHVIGSIVKYAQNNKLYLLDLKLDQLQKFCPQIENDVYDYIDWNFVLNKYRGKLSANPDMVKEYLCKITNLLKKV